MTSLVNAHSGKGGGFCPVIQLKEAIHDDPTICFACIMEIFFSSSDWRRRKRQESISFENPVSPVHLS
eukprot:CAMPEP_0178753294 /NCGR_PEP_ID=MMETSP0744-20121128/11534_1 /TAXON_ID=913974 /ORGANISM="Nitzschia punctata, Strain CCMP561" /LENGTH=67 /DNA_ID=CAMNT_0020407099 /DNA_START=453 /DNA_END=652 /DNA_ORIENTATION=+